MNYQQIIKNNQQWIDETWAKLDRKLSKTAIKSRNKIPYTTTDGVHTDHTNHPGRWTNGFWGGLMWLMYEGTGKEEYKLTAQTSEKLMDKAFENVAALNHDVGFMWHITSGASYRLTGDMKSRNRNLLVAMILASRFEVDGNYIRC